MRKGAVELLMVLVTSIFGVFLVMAWQSRLLLSLQRGKAQSDLLILNYVIESKIFDTVAKFIGNFPSAFSFPFVTEETLTDGTKIKTQGEEAGNIQTLNITAKRQFATTNMTVKREYSESSEDIVKDTQIVLSLDCTQSMSDPYCNGCGPTDPTRMQVQKQAVIAFLNALDLVTGHEKVKVGISVFAMKANWLYTHYKGDGTPDGTPLDLEHTLTKTEIINAINSQLNDKNVQNSPACKNTLEYTSVGSGTAFMNDYLKSPGVKVAGTKQIEILITDGEPNQRIPYSGCAYNNFCPPSNIYCCPLGSQCSKTGWTCPRGSGNNCKVDARDFLKCTMANTGENWSLEKSPFTDYPGTKDPDVDIYTVTVYDTVIDEVRNIFTTYSKHYYEEGDASNLVNVLKDILTKILSSQTSFTINKIVPTPEE